MAWWDGLFGQRKRRALPAPSRPIARGPIAPAAGASRLPRFRSFAADQLRALRGEPLQEARLKLRDAFTPSRPVTDPQMFAGRTEILDTLIRSIEEQKLHVVLYGDRGIGKTSLLHVLAQLAGDARYLVHYASCGAETDFDTLIRTVAADIPLLYHSSYTPGETEGEGARNLAGLLPAGPVTPRMAGDLFSRLTATRLLLIVDEFDQSGSGPFRRQIAELIKTLSDRSIPVQLVVAGVAANLTELLEAIPSIRRNILGLQVPLMDQAETAALIERADQASGVHYTPAAIDRITATAAGSPYLASLLGQHAGLATIDRGELIVTPDDVATALQRASDEIEGRVSERSRISIKAARAAGLGSLLDQLARGALDDNGRFALSGGDASVASPLAERFHLIEPMPGDPAERYRFTEESVPVYLWIDQARFGPDRDESVP